INKDKEIVFDNKWSVHGLTFLQGLVKKGLANIPVEAPSHKIIKDFLDEKIAMIVGPSDVVMTHRDQHIEFPLGISLMPHPDGGRPLSYASYGFYCISATSKHIDESIKLINQLTKSQLLQ